MRNKEDIIANIIVVLTTVTVLTLLISAVW